MRLALAALVLYATPALAQTVICTKPDGTKYVGSSPPEGCVTDRPVDLAPAAPESAEAPTEPSSPASRFVVDGSDIGRRLWITPGVKRLCDQAMVASALGGPKDRERKDCGEGSIGVRGTLSIGTEVELLDAGACEDMAHVRVVTGSLKGQTGCIGSARLSMNR